MTFESIMVRLIGANSWTYAINYSLRASNFTYDAFHVMLQNIFTGLLLIGSLYNRANILHFFPTWVDVKTVRQLIFCHYSLKYDKK